MKAIWKFSIDERQATGITEFEMPNGSEIVHVAAQGEYLCFWAEVEPDWSKVRRQFLVFMTGAKIPSHGLVYRGTAFMPSGIVAHLYEVSAPDPIGLSL